jgi:type I restriction enzyme R subunit
VSGDTAHQEKHFEAYIVARLQKQGWLIGDTKHYDTEHALYPDDLVGWLEVTQAEKWAKLCKDYPADPRGVLMERLSKTLEKDGTVQTLRRGFAIAGCGQDKRNADVLKRYAANLLRVVPQLKYHPARELAIDLVFFINGIPVATVEVKTDFTQSADAAVEQYKTDRLPVDPKRQSAGSHCSPSNAAPWCILRYRIPKSR